MVVVTHEMGFAKKVGGTRILFYGRRRDAEEGTPQQILRTPE